MRQSHTTDDAGFNYMENSGQEEHDRDMVGIVLVLAAVTLVAAGPAGLARLKAAWHKEG